MGKEGLIMSELLKLQDKHRQEIKELQENCKHEGETGWLQYFWAPGHWNGSYVKQCLKCGKTFEYKSSSGNEVSTFIFNDDEVSLKFSRKD